MLKTKEIVGVVVSKIGSGGALAPAQPRAEPQPAVQTTPAEPQKSAQPEPQAAPPEPKKTESKSAYDSVKQIKDDVKDGVKKTGDELNKAYDSLKSLF